jgi:hypothetical protein
MAAASTATSDQSDRKQKQHERERAPWLLTIEASHAKASTASERARRAESTAAASTATSDQSERKQQQHERERAPCPFNIEAWRYGLRNHPDRAWVRRLLHGIEFGVDIGYTGDRERARTHVNNLKSAVEPGAEQAISKYIDEEVKLGRQAGPFASPPMSNLVVSPLGAVPKKGTSKHRVVHHLSWPRNGDSINSAIEPMECELTSFDDGTALVVAVGRGALMSKIDIRAAYRCIPVRPEDWHLLGMRWRDFFYYEKCLPFGLSSSCALWEEYATAAEWIIKSLGVKSLVHYIDDTLLVSPAGLERATKIMQLVLRTLAALGMPIALDKLVGPSTQLTYLGIEIDSIAMEARLDAARLATTKEMLSAWSEQSRCSHRDLLSLIGTLSFVAKVVRPGRIFLRRMINLATATEHCKLVKLSDDFKRDLQWWSDFIADWNGVSLLYAVGWPADAACVVATDACESGLGAYCDGHWISRKWTTGELNMAHSHLGSVDATAGVEAQARSMPFLELAALVIAAATWCDQWSGKRVTFHCDCEPVVFAASKLTSPSASMMHLIRSLFMIAARAHFEFRVLHIAGVTNTVADALSRCQIDRFRLLCPDSDRSPTTPSPLPTLRC